MRRLQIGALAGLFVASAAAATLGASAWGHALAALLCLACGIYAAPRIFTSRALPRLRWGVMTLVPLLWGFLEALRTARPAFEADAGRAGLVFACARAFVCLIVAVNGAVFSLTGRKLKETPQYFVDCGAILWMILGFVYFVLINRRFGELSGLSAYQWVKIACLCLDIVTQVFLLSNFLDWRPGDRHLPSIFISIGVFVFCFFDGFPIYEAFNADLRLPAFALDGGYLLAMLLFGCGAASADPRRPWSEDTDLAHDFGRRSARKGILLLLVPIALSCSKGFVPEVLTYFAELILSYATASLLLSRLLHSSNEALRLERRVRERTAELEQANAALERAARTDEATGLFNRAYFVRLLDEAIEAAGRGALEGRNEAIWLVFLDIDRFKGINDSYGHDLGDRLLRMVTKRLSLACDDRCSLARLGGDEFAILCRRGRSEGIGDLTERVEAALAGPIRLGHLVLRPTLGIGAAAYPDDAGDRPGLMRAADMALYRAKRGGSRAVAFFDAELSHAIARQNRLEFALRAASIADEFEVRYQPQFAMDGRRLVGAEALLRWHSPELGQVSPDEFIPVAEESGLIIPLSDWMTREALARAKDWNVRFGLGLVMSVNVSPVQMEDVRFIAKFQSLLAEMAAPSSWLKVEITERVAMKDEDEVLSIFEKLEAMGIPLAVDDFGTGYSSLSYLKKYDVDYLKIAKELIDGAIGGASDAQLVRAIVSMARALGIRTIAEGVESEDQFAFLASLGCDEVQGYLLGGPVGAGEFETRHLTPARDALGGR
jgi:diguanylate cyclase (GGDEF)-like protein